MTPLLRSVPFFALATMMFVLAGAGIAALLSYVGRTRLVRWDPRARHTVLLVLLALPLGLGLAMLVATTAPSWLSTWLPQLDHCMSHDDAHAHLCFVHLPSVHVHPLVAAGLLALTGWSLLRALLFVVKLVRALRVLRSLARTGECDEGLGATVIDSAQPVCMAAGILRPRVLVSRGLLGQLDDEGQQVVLAHERAHVERRDALYATLGRGLAEFHFSWVAAWLVRELDIAAEQACDDEAALVVNDRLSVASAIVQVQRMVQGHHMGATSPLTVSLVQHAVERRVEALFDSPPARMSLRVPMVLASLAVIMLFALSGEVHHITEFLLSGLTR